MTRAQDRTAGLRRLRTLSAAATVATVASAGLATAVVTHQAQAAASVVPPATVQPGTAPADGTGTSSGGSDTTNPGVSSDSAPALTQPALTQTYNPPVTTSNGS